jgi:hypothetical protein
MVVLLWKRRDFLDELEILLGEERAHRGRRVCPDLRRSLGTGDRDRDGRMIEHVAQRELPERLPILKGTQVLDLLQALCKPSLLRPVVADVALGEGRVF